MNLHPSRQRSRLLASLVFLAGSLLGQIAWADPCGMVPPIPLTARSPALTRVGDQLTYVFFKDGVEDLVLRPAFEGKVSEFGMLIPFPAPPEIRKVSDDIFAHVKSAVAPPEVVIDLRWRGRCLDRLEERAASEPLMLYAQRAKRDAVVVLKEEAVGMYQVAVLAAADASALREWMEKHGYVYPDGMDSVCQEYLDAQWCFAAVKANVAGKAALEPHPGMENAHASMPADATFAGAVQAMGFRFRVEEPVIPMRLSAFNPGQLHNIVYVLSDRPCRITQLPEHMVTQQIPGARLHAHLTQPLPVRVLGGDEDSPEVQQIIAQYDRDPVPHNGHAAALFAADLLAVRERTLTHRFEEREKELLRIGERLGLRGPEIDARIASAIASEREAALGDVLAELESMTLTVIEGDFPRNVIAADNLTLADYTPPLPAVPRADTEQGQIERSNTFGSGGIVLAGGGLLLLSCLCGLGAHRRRQLITVLVLVPILAAPQLALATEPVLAPSLEDLVAQLGDPAQAEAALAALVERGNAALPFLIGEAVEGPDVARRGWALVGLASLDSEGARAVLRVVRDDPRSSGLLRMWSRAALVRAGGGDAFADLLRGAQRGGTAHAEVMEVIMGLEQNALDPLLAVALSHDDNSLRQLAVSVLGGLDGRVGASVVRGRLLAALRFQKDAAFPWQGGALYLPRVAWGEDDARALTLELAAWLVHAEQQEATELARQVCNNLRDLSWRNGMGFQQHGRAVDWVRALLALHARDPQDLGAEPSHRMLMLVLDLLRD